MRFRAPFTVTLIICYSGGGPVSGSMVLRIELSEFFLALTDSVSFFQPMFCVAKRTHRAFVRAKLSKHVSVTQRAPLLTVSATNDLYIHTLGGGGSVESSLQLQVWSFNGNRAEITLGKCLVGIAVTITTHLTPKLQPGERIAESVQTQSVQRALWNTRTSSSISGPSSQQLLEFDNTINFVDEEFGSIKGPVPSWNSDQED